MFRPIALVLLLAAPTFAQTVIEDGDYEEELFVLDDSLLMTGGQVDVAVLWSNGPYEIEGGILGRTELESGDIFVSGGSVDWIIRSDERSGGTPTSVTFEGAYFRYYDAGLREYNSYVIEGWLADGSFIHTRLDNSLELATRVLPLEFNIVPLLPPEGDVDSNWVVDLEDLNYVRNNFGSEGIDLDLLNEVRNTFGLGTFSLSLDDPHVHEVRGNPVPEPDAIQIAFYAILGCALFYMFKEQA
jgi:hypothetical protein